jgi:hypothetical protein
MLSRARAVLAVAALVALVASEVHLTTSYAAVAAALLLFLATTAFGPQSAAPLGLYGIAVLLWGTACAGLLRNHSRTNSSTAIQK